LPWFEYDSFEETFDNLKDNYSGNGGTALALMTKAKRISIKLITDLSDNIWYQNNKTLPIIYKW